MQVAAGVNRRATAVRRGPGPVQQRKPWKRTIPITIEDRQIDGPHGTIGVRVYAPDGVAGAGLVWAHGGAFYGGDIDMPEAV